MTEKEDGSGLCYYLGQSGKSFIRKGSARCLLNNGSVFIGDYQMDRVNKGKLYEL